MSFKVYLPASEGTKVADRVLLDTDTRKNDATILIVDDEAIITSMLVDYLKSLGYKTMLATNGIEAVAIVAEHKDAIDIVILDINMPLMDGCEAYAKFIEIKPDINVLVSTGYVSSCETQEILQKGAKGFIQKPFKMDEIKGKISTILRSDTQA
nr:response regulator [Desulfobulbaceae bacterium]